MASGHALSAVYVYRFPSGPARLSPTRRTDLRRHPRLGWAPRRTRSSIGVFVANRASHQLNPFGRGSLSRLRCSSKWPMGVQPTSAVSTGSALKAARRVCSNWRRSFCAGDVGLQARRGREIPAGVHIHGDQRAGRLDEQAAFGQPGLRPLKQRQRVQNAMRLEPCEATQAGRPHQP